jgi:hypothetical protein
METRDEDVGFSDLHLPGEQLARGDDVPLVRDRIAAEHDASAG